MNWSDVGNLVGKAAPLVGTALLGAPGGAIGGLVASVLGVDNTPDAVYEAIQADPQAIERLKRMEIDHAEEMRRLTLESETNRLTEINKTMRAEYQADGWYKSGWRPAIGWNLALSFGGLSAALVYAIAKDPTLVSDQAFTGMLVWLFVTMASILGVNVSKRSQDKQIAAGQQPSSILGSLLGRVKK
ncbi:3TM-type holin [Guyparkeria sp. GHLCS8-2]|uniref:3TM-type holin n=1 Tax=Guyparkeria halopsychrophila TaxID=3139421 RepID=UPI0037C7422C